MNVNLKKKTVTHQEAEGQTECKSEDKKSDAGNIYDAALSNGKKKSRRYICPEKSHISHFPHVVFWDA